METISFPEINNLLFVQEEKTMLQPDQRGSRTFLSAVLLTLTGGYLDAYTYFVRGKVFANAQTGNIIKLAINAAQMNFSQCLHFLFPILAFAAGVVLSLFIEGFFEKKGLPYIRRTVLCIEILCMVIISFIPQSENADIIANILVSLLCAMQMQTFQIFDKKIIATTVGTGNLRKGIVHLYKAFQGHDSADLKAAGQFFAVTVLFITGIVLGTLVSEHLGTYSILVPACFLVLAVVHITAVFHRHLPAENA